MNATAEEIRPMLIALKEQVSSWTKDESLSRVLNGQIRAAERMLEHEQWEQARGALLVLMAGIRAGGPTSWSRGL